MIGSPAPPVTYRHSCCQLHWVKTFSVISKNGRGPSQTRNEGKKMTYLLALLVSHLHYLYSSNWNLIADDLLLRLDFRDPEPKIIDLSPHGNVVPTLQEAKIECLTNHKVTPIPTTTEMKLWCIQINNYQDVYLYYFLLRHPGRSLVFLSSIDGIRRLMPLLERLAIKAFPLHSQLEQRQRLKNLDRFVIDSVSCPSWIHSISSTVSRQYPMLSS